ncbi:MAG: response regulator transcription factor [Dehalococcoidia bacterium]|nr:response regulator transcription factor [Dehalococcoidia bacterium]
MPRILIVEDEPTLAQALRYNLEREGYRVTLASQGQEALDAFHLRHPDLVILDLILPDMDGLEVCRALRRHSSVPILILTARGEETDRVVGLELGADDYMVKPFSMRELVARVRALLRRAQSSPPDEVLVSSDLRLDLRRREAYRGGMPLPLRPKEFDLLAFFMRHRGRALSREEILTHVWGVDVAVDTRTVDVHVRWLREKVENVPSKPTRIITVRGLGYRFEG